MSCRVAHYFQQQGYKKGEVSRKTKELFFLMFHDQVVALVMENRVDYCCYWIGENQPT